MPLQCYSWQCHSNLYIFNNNNNNNSQSPCCSSFGLRCTVASFQWLRASERIQITLQRSSSYELFTELHRDVCTTRREVVYGRRSPIVLTFVHHISSPSETDRLLRPTALSARKSLPDDITSAINNNNNIIPRQRLWCCHHGRAIARVHPVHLMNVERRKAAADPRPSQTTFNSHTQAVSPLVQAVRVYHRHLLLLLSPKADILYSFYCPTEGRRLSRRSPILVQTGSNVVQLRWSKPTRYH